MNELNPVRFDNLTGIYYPKTSIDIIASINSFFSKIESNSRDKNLLSLIGQCLSKKNFLTLIVPHGSYKYSGLISAYAYYILNKIKRFDNFIIVSADHNGTSPGISIMDHGYWQTPFGNMTVNEKLAYDLCHDEEINDVVSIDKFSFDIDNTIEPHLPFLQYINGSSIKFLPILIGLQCENNILQFTKALGKIISKNESLVVIATSNLSHYFDYYECYVKDHEILSTILSMNIHSFYKLIENSNNKVNVCGYGCIALAMELAKIMGNNDSILLKYQTSGDMDDSKTSVVGYSSIVFL